jgi:hypothetical protein
MIISTELETLIATTSPSKLAGNVRNNPAIMAEIENSIGDTITEKLYNHVTESKLTPCQHGNNHVFKSFNQGYTICGNAAKCKCAADAIRDNI